MTELNETADFEENLGRLLKTVEDEELREILRQHTETILSVAEESTKERRAPLRESIEDLIDKRAEEQRKLRESEVGE